MPDRWHFILSQQLSAVGALWFIVNQIGKRQDVHFTLSISNSDSDAAVTIQAASIDSTSVPVANRGLPITMPIGHPTNTNRPADVRLRIVLRITPNLRLHDAPGR